MKIYYDVDEITDNCKYDCPFKDFGYKGEIGEDCKVGSVTCQECKFCYGHHDPFKQEIGVIFVDGKRILKPIRYIKCMWVWITHGRKKSNNSFIELYIG